MSGCSAILSEARRAGVVIRLRGDDLRVIGLKHLKPGGCRSMA